MILYFSATGNSLAIARQLAERLNERLMLLTEAVKQDLTGEKRIGLVFPTYDFNLPPAMPEMVARLKISPQSLRMGVAALTAQERYRTGIQPQGEYARQQCTCVRA